MEPEFHNEWREFVSLLIRHRAKFLIVGAHALAAHGRPRYTSDLDIWVESSRTNARRICAALTDFGFDAFADEDYFASSPPGLHGIQLGVEPLRIDVIKSLPEITFRTAWKHRLRTRIKNLTVHIIGRADYLKTKRSSDRAIDRIDVELLEEVD